MPEPTSSPALEDIEYLREQVRAARERLLIERLRPRYWLARMVVAVSLAMFCRLYRAASRRWGPQGLTFSAFAFKHAQETGCVFWRVKVDAIFMLLTGQEQHCQQQFQRERQPLAVKDEE